MKRLLVLAAGLLVACSSHPPELRSPDTVESYCPGRAPSGDVVREVLSSVADAMQTIDVPDEALLGKLIRDTGGAIGHWQKQPFYLPGVARVLGVNRDYLTVTDLAIPGGNTRNDSRIVYATVIVGGAPKVVPLRAYDSGNICTEGTPEP